MNHQSTTQQLAAETADWINLVFLHDYDFNSVHASRESIRYGIHLGFYNGPDQGSRLRAPRIYLWGEDIAANFWFELALLMTDSKGYDAWLEDCDCVEFSITTGNFFHEPDWADLWNLQHLVYDNQDNPSDWHYTYLTIALTDHSS